MGPGEAVYNVGKCRCQINRYGTACEKSKIQMGSNEYYPEESPVACSGRGIPVVNQYPAVCQCNSMSTGSKCEQIRCPGFDKAVFNNGIQKGAPEDPECGMGKGQCVTSGENAGRCECQGNNACGVPAADMKAGCPGACLYEDCANNCGGAAGEQKIDEMVWTSSMDKWGWSTCSPGTLLIGMKTDMKQSKDALYNLDSGLCQQPWEAGSKISNALHTSRCYHENWWKKFDTRGGKFCRRNYFVAGLFRSHCNSLYLLRWPSAARSSARCGLTASGPVPRAGTRTRTASRSPATRDSSLDSSVVPSTLLPASLPCASVLLSGTVSSSR